MVAYGLAACLAIPVGRPRETARTVDVGVFLPFAAMRPLETWRWAGYDWSVGEYGIAGGDGHPPKLRKSG